MREVRARALAATVLLAELSLERFPSRSFRRADGPCTLDMVDVRITSVSNDWVVCGWRYVGKSLSNLSPFGA